MTEDQYCVCKPNYVGDRCEACGPGYFGEPNTPGGSCEPCQCNGNIDVQDYRACNSVSGLCQVKMIRKSFLRPVMNQFLPIGSSRGRVKKKIGGGGVSTGQLSLFIFFIFFLFLTS